MNARSLLPPLLAAVAAGWMPEPGGTSASSTDLRELLAAARGVAPALCVLAADGVSGWGEGWSAPAPPLASEVRARVHALRRSRPSPEETQALLAGLAATDPRERHLAAVLLGRAEDAALAPEVGRRLSSASAEERAAALVALGMMEAASQADAVVRPLRDTSPDVRANAAWALGRMEAARTAPAIEGVLGDAEAMVRTAAVVALGKLESRGSAPALARVLTNDQDAGVRRVAAWALGQLGERAPATSLAGALKGDRAPEVREMAAWALAETGWPWPCAATRARRCARRPPGPWASSNSGRANRP
jgi:HEAT repeat protein